MARSSRKDSLARPGSGRTGGGAEFITWKGTTPGFGRRPYVTMGCRNASTMEGRRKVRESGEQTSVCERDGSLASRRCG